MAEKEDSIHIRIKLDIDAEDKKFIEGVAQQLAEGDEKRIVGQAMSKKQKDKMQGPPTKMEWDIQQLENQIELLQRKRRQRGQKKWQGPLTKVQMDEQQKEKLQIKLNQQKIKALYEGNVGKVQNMSSQAFSNFTRLLNDPFGFFAAAFTKKLGKFGVGFARAGIAGVIAIFVYEIVMFTIRQLMEPGRMFDRRFRRIAQVETLKFYDRQLQEDLRKGFAEIRVATSQGLRGGASQVNGNLFEFSGLGTGLIASAPYRSSHDISGRGYLSGSPTSKSGNPKRRTVNGRFG